MNNMKTNQTILSDFNIEELDNRFEMKTWVVYHPPGEIIS